MGMISFWEQSLISYLWPSIYKEFKAGNIYKNKQINKRKMTKQNQGTGERWSDSHPSIIPVSVNLKPLQPPQIPRILEVMEICMKIFHTHRFLRILF